MDLVLFVSALLFLLLCSGFFSASETALFSLSPIRIKAYQTDADPRRRLIADLVLQPRDLLVTVFMLNTLVNILLQNVASSMVGTTAGWIQKVGIPLALTLVVGEIIPKYIGLQNNVALAYRFAPAINFLQILLKPVRQWIISITAPISRAMFFFLKKEKSISREELHHVLKTSEAHGVLQPFEAELVSGYLDLQETLVKELLRPREDMLCYEIHEPLSKLVHLFMDKKRSWIPVFDTELENILGIISAKEYFLHQQEIREPKNLRRFLTKPFYIPENTSARTLLRKLQENKLSMAIVVDEYGSIAGLITLSDIIDVVIGLESEDLKQTKLYTRSGEHEIIASGKLELAVFNEIFDVYLESASSMVTLGGWLIEQLGDIPKSGTKYKTKDFLFQVLAADPNRIRRIYVRKITKTGSPEKKKGSPQK